MDEFSQLYGRPDREPPARKQIFVPDPAMIFWRMAECHPNGCQASISRCANEKPTIFFNQNPEPAARKIEIPALFYLFSNLTRHTEPHRTIRHSPHAPVYLPAGQL
jgi:hypothetical protein